MKTFSGRRASQNETELRGFIAFLQQKDVTTYLEIGARHGDTFHEIMHQLPVGSCGLAVDLPGALWGNHQSRSALRDAVNDLNDKGYECQYLFGDSKDPDVLAAVQKFAERHGRFGAILIDGDHTLAGVVADWRNYSSLAPYIAFHDIVGLGQREKVYQNPVEVPILWEEIKKDFKTVEFIAEGSAMGIGVVCLP